MFLLICVYHFPGNFIDAPSESSLDAKCMAWAVSVIIWNGRLIRKDEVNSDSRF